MMTSWNLWYQVSVLCELKHRIWKTACLLLYGDVALFYWYFLDKIYFNQSCRSSEAFKGPGGIFKRLLYRPLNYLANKNEHVFHEGGSYHIENSLLICFENQWTGFYMIGTSVMKKLKLVILPDVFVTEWCALITYFM